MKLLAATGFEFGNSLWSGGVGRHNADGLIGSYLSSATDGVVEWVGTFSSSFFMGPSYKNTTTYAPDGTSLVGNGALFNASVITQSALRLNVSSSFEFNCDVTGQPGSTSLGNGSVLLWLKTTTGKTYDLRMTADAGWVLRKNDTTVSLSGNNYTNKDSSWTVLYCRVMTWNDGANDQFTIEAVSSQNTAEIVHYTEEASFAIADVRIKGNDRSGEMDDLTIYELDSGDVGNGMTGFTSNLGTAFDFGAHLMEIPVVAKAAGTNKNIEFWTETSPDWTPNSVNVETDVSDGNDTTYAEMGSKEVGWEMYDGSAYLAASDLYIQTDAGVSLIVGPIHAIKFSQWRVQDDDEQEINLHIIAPGAVLDSDGTTASPIQSKQTATKAGVVGQSGMISHLFDCSGKAGSLSGPLDESTALQLRASASL